VVLPLLMAPGLEPRQVDRSAVELRIFAFGKEPRVRQPTPQREKPKTCSQSSAFRLRPWRAGLALLCAFVSLPLAASGKEGIQWGAGLVMNVPFPENEVVQVVEDVAQNGIIRGTKEYAKDEYISGAAAASSTRVFPEKTEGKVFYKIRLKTLDPRNFKDSTDMGTLAVRYVLQPRGDKNTIVRIDARFVEDFRRVSHASNGSVESAEFKDIHDQLESLQLMKSETVEAEKQKQEYLSNKLHPNSVPPTANESSSGSSLSSTPSTPQPRSEVAVPPSEISQSAAPTPPVETGAVETIEQHVQDLRRQVERTVKSPGAPLKSAPFNTANTLRTLPAGTEVLIVVSTTYWFGIETHDGQHGWILRDQLELLP
jgi:hypothetical protein